MTENKKSGHPTQPGNRSNAPKQPQRNRRAIIYQIGRLFKRVNWARLATLCLAIIGIIYLLSPKYGTVTGGNNGPVEAAPPETEITEEQPVTTETEIAEEQPEMAETEIVEEQPEMAETEIVEEQPVTPETEIIEEHVKRYELTDSERWEVASVVTAEASGEPFEGMVAVAQCILQACEDEGIRPCEAVIEYKYTKNRPEPTKEALEAVQAVFDFGQVATTEPIKYYYAPALVYSEWHESQEYVITINNHRFFKEAE